MKLGIRLVAILISAILLGCARQPTLGTITTIAGSGDSGYLGDGGPAILALLSNPQSIAIDANGNLYIADEGNNVIRAISPEGVITTVAGTGKAGFGGDGGPATEAQVMPYSVAIDHDGRLIVVEHAAHRIRRIDNAGIIMTIAGTRLPGHSGDGGPATLAELNEPHHVAFDSSGAMYISDHGNRIRKVDANGIITTVAGTGTEGFSGDGGPAIDAQLNAPMGMAIDADGNLFIADAQNRRIRRVDPNGIITTLAGTGDPGSDGDGGLATDAQLTPISLAFGAEGNLYFADIRGLRVGVIDQDGIIWTVAGTGSSGFGGDGGPAIDAQFRYPIGIFINSTGDLYIADRNDHRVRMAGQAD